MVVRALLSLPAAGIGAFAQYPCIVITGLPLPLPPPGRQLAVLDGHPEEVGPRALEGLSTPVEHSCSWLGQRYPWS